VVVEAVVVVVPQVRRQSCKSNYKIEWVCRLVSAITANDPQLILSALNRRYVPHPSCAQWNTNACKQLPCKAVTESSR
jgi:hypothetical protein